MTSERDDMAELDAAFAAARDAQPEPSDALMARIMADAAAVQAGRVAAVRPSARRARRGAKVLALLGGWPALGGLVTATVAGVWLGLNPPPQMENLTFSYLGVETGPVIDTSAERVLGLLDEEGT